MRNRSLAALIAAIVSIATIAGACGDDPSVNPTSPDSGDPLEMLGESVCPDAAPGAGEGCVVPEGTTCAYGVCSPIAQCSQGAWRYSGNPPARPPCPKDFPVSDSVCPPCWPTGLECTYGSRDCSMPDASANTTVASCADGGAGSPLRWSLRTFPCVAVTDAGADVQRDAEPDAD
ncbi:MAG: hypothetical protein BGO98_36525 [Myxococcales bacterium 68-20]|nr:hypothetical protein [Myxococcales bacterium]OJY26085.1 MAG: hypothetical protein BGO98_36525 [Myxococcales bacterium 68-20]